MEGKRLDNSLKAARDLPGSSRRPRRAPSLEPAQDLSAPARRSADSAAPRTPALTPAQDLSGAAKKPRAAEPAREPDMAPVRASARAASKAPSDKAPSDKAPSGEAATGARAPKRRRKRINPLLIVLKIIWKMMLAVFTLCLIGVLTAFIFYNIFMRYVDNNLRGKVEVELTAYNPSVSSEMYYYDPSDPDAGEDGWVMYKPLFLKAENRIWVTLDEVPEHLQKAYVAVEDKRFYEHNGADLRGIARAVVSTLGSGGTQGGSTITQQMIKNVTGDNQNTVKRKVLEVYRAIQVEKEYGKDEILEYYLNYIYMGESCYGVKTAAKMYFGKDVSELDLAESASLAAITNNPSMYDPFISNNTRANNLKRQAWVLLKMKEQGFITEGQYNAALHEEIMLSNGYAVKIAMGIDEETGEEKEIRTFEYVGAAAPSEGESHIEVTLSQVTTSLKRAIASIRNDYAFETLTDEVLEAYLNDTDMGHRCIGFASASRLFFGKNVGELTTAESVALAVIASDTAAYDPYIGNEARLALRSRQLAVLADMLENGLLTQESYAAACEDIFVFTNGYDIEGQRVSTGTASNSYYDDQVIEDVIADLMAKYGYDRKMAENKVFSGLKIYTAQNIAYQRICEEVFENTSYQNVTGDKYGDPLQAAITLMDPETGAVLAMVGGTGVKTTDRAWNWATAPRQCGSSVKPISTYAPALDDGTINAASRVDDYPLLFNGHAYPHNATMIMNGMYSCMDGLYRSYNIVAVRVNLLYGTTRSYNFMVEKLGFTTLDADVDAVQVGNMALGGFNHGVTTEEMCAAFCTFAHDGYYTRPYTYYKVTDADGNVLLENKPEYSVAFKETTVYTIRETLKRVVATGTGWEARLSRDDVAKYVKSQTGADYAGMFNGVEIAGKTGTTNDKFDRYFVGFTPDFCAAVWTGFAKNQKIPLSENTNPSCVLWHDCMVRIYALLDQQETANPEERLYTRSFPGEPDGFVTVTVCADSGLLASDACKHDLRGSRVVQVRVAEDSQPTEKCTMHKEVEYCKDGHHIATQWCPATSVMPVSVLDVDRELIDNLRPNDYQYTLQYLSGASGDAPSICPVHDSEPAPEPPPEPEPPDDPTPTDDPTPPDDPTPEPPEDPVDPEDPVIDDPVDPVVDD